MMHETYTQYKLEGLRGHIIDNYGNKTSIPLSVYSLLLNEFQQDTPSHLLRSWAQKTKIESQENQCNMIFLLIFQELILCTGLYVFPPSVRLVTPSLVSKNGWLPPVYTSSVYRQVVSKYKGKVSPLYSGLSLTVRSQRERGTQNHTGTLNKSGHLPLVFTTDNEDPTSQSLHSVEEIGERGR